MIHVTSTTPLSGMLCNRGPALAAIDQYAKFHVSMSTRYEDMKGNRQCGKWVAVSGHSRSLEIAPFDTAHPISLL